MRIEKLVLDSDHPTAPHPCDPARFKSARSFLAFWNLMITNRYSHFCTRMAHLVTVTIAPGEGYVVRLG